MRFAMRLKDYLTYFWTWGSISFGNQINAVPDITGLKSHLRVIAPMQFSSASAAFGFSSQTLSSLHDATIVVAFELYFYTILRLEHTNTHTMGFSEDQMKALKDSFETFDKDKDGNSLGEF